ncbi:MAG: N-acetylmuramoyl-L-alanine amidase [Candidatus Eisenbacteria bacterium]|nr:N-acetylmuramoyl-L-alanine amidase [Candidatus Eisenbacteria bacterium]
MIRRSMSPIVLLALATAMLAAIAPAAFARSEISAVRFWTAPDHTRIVVDLTEEAQYSTRVLSDPDRIVVLIVGGGVGEAIRNTPVGDGIVDRIRLNQLGSGAQVVVDLPRPRAHTVFPLEPYLTKPNRVVIDVFDGDAPPVEAASEARAADASPRVIIIDAGHGGEDPGTLGNGKLKEKDVVLDIAKKLAAELKSRGGYEVHMTRDGDYFVRLARRKEIANKSKGDIFISIHANSAPNRKASGTEVFYVSEHGASDQAARELADRENAADLVGGVSPDADDDVLSILVDLKMSDCVQKSSDLAALVDGALSKERVSRCAVKQAGFLVLKSLSMPSIIVEVGFLTNASDVEKLKEPDYRLSYAQCLAKAVDQYFDRYSPAVAQGGMHKVGPGETLWSIARRYNVSVEELRSLNGLDPDATIRINQVLSVCRS